MCGPGGLGIHTPARTSAVLPKAHWALRLLWGMQRDGGLGSVLGSSRMLWETRPPPWPGLVRPALKGAGLGYTCPPQSSVPLLGWATWSTPPPT